MKSHKGLREAMPCTTAFIDQMREAFGVDGVNASIKAGIAGDGSFYANENGVEIGSRPREIDGKAVNGHEICRQKGCDGCCHASVKLVSPDGYRLKVACKLYRVAAGRCADWSAVK